MYVGAFTLIHNNVNHVYYQFNISDFSNCSTNSEHIMEFS